MSDIVSFEALAPDSPWVAEVAAWQHALWGYHNPAHDAEQWQADVRRHCGGTGMPSVWLARAAGEVAGTASLVPDDGDIRRDLSPWLASVYVLPAFRGRGIASALVRHLEARAAASGHAALHLFTPDQQALYARLGWSPLERRFHCGEWVSVMRRTLV